jgi:hypothetical protein
MSRAECPGRQAIAGKQETAFGFGRMDEATV